ncbi:MAG: hypothetical protein HZB16_21585 [Armatimonadetes bacterium]|nr:hypothetical protein [Armatimonadota bacterium]
MTKLLCVCAALLAAVGGAWAQAEATPYVSQWMVVGPFANEAAAGFDAVYGPEQDKDFRAGTFYDGLGGKVGWTMAEAADGVLNFVPLYPEHHENVAAYAYVRIVAPKALECDLSLGSDDGCKAFLNGELVHSNPADRACAKDSDKAKLALREGDNDLLIKVVQGGADWALAARLTKREAALDGVRFTLGRLGGQTTPMVTKYMVIGPFDNDGGVGFDAEYAPERRVDLKRAADGLGGKVKWQPLTTGDNGMVNFKAAFPDRQENAVAYLYLTLNAPREVPCRMLLGSDDGVKVWLNDTLVHANNASRPCQADEDKVPVTLQAGENKLLVKVTQSAGGWEFCLRFAQTGESLDGVTFGLPE